MSEQNMLIGTVVILVIENVLPYLPIKANSSTQVVLNILKSIFGKKV